MAEHAGEAIVLRTWPFHEADLLVSLFTREHGRVKGVARHAMRSRRRFGGALEPMTRVRARWAERKGEDLVQLDSFEILDSPLSAPVDYARVASLEFVAEVLDELPEGIVDDAVFRLAVSTAGAIRVGCGALPVTYFSLWMNRLMGWMPHLGACVVCGEALGGRAIWYSAASDGVTCADDRRPGATALSPVAVASATRLFRESLAEIGARDQDREGPLYGEPAAIRELERFAIETLERHLERRLLCARTLLRI